MNSRREFLRRISAGGMYLPFAGNSAGQTDAPAVSVRCYEAHEFELIGKSNVANPFRDAALIGIFVAPSGKSIPVEGFYCGDDKWKLRFVPEEKGEYRYTLRGEGAALSSQGRLVASTPREKGFIRIHPKDRYGFAYSDGTAFFPMGDTCYGLHDDTPVTDELRRLYLDTRRAQHFNFVRMSIQHSPTRAAADPKYWPWGGTPAAPDYDRFNPAFFESLEAVIAEMRTRGMNVELILLNLNLIPFNSPELWTNARQRAWLRYVVARLGSYPNLFLWTVANEYERHPDGKYRLDRPDDFEWAKSVVRQVHEVDPYKHPATVHPVISSSSRGSGTSDEFDPPWRIGGFFGESREIDVLSQQTSTVYRSNWDEKLQCWMGDAGGLERSIEADRLYGKPVLNTENGYEYLPGYPTNKRQVYHTDRVRRASWRIVCAGGYFAAGFISTVAHSDVWDKIDAPNRYPFLVRDAGAGKQLGYLYQFFTALPFWRMAPRPDLVPGDELCYAAAGEAYVVYLSQGHRFHLRLDNPGTGFAARWFNPRSGEYLNHVMAARPEDDYSPPDSEDWALLVQRTKGAR